jgi:hypothetical protein
LGRSDLGFVSMRRLEKLEEDQETLEGINILELRLLSLTLLYTAEFMTMMSLKFKFPILEVKVVQMSRPEVKLLCATPSSSINPSNDSLAKLSAQATR